MATVTFEQTITSKARRGAITIDADGTERIDVDIIDADGAVMYTRRVSIGVDGTVKVSASGNARLVSSKPDTACRASRAAHEADVDALIAANTDLLGAAPGAVVAKE